MLPLFFFFAAYRYRGNDPGSDTTSEQAKLYRQASVVASVNVVFLAGSSCVFSMLICVVSFVFPALEQC